MSYSNEADGGGTAPLDTGVRLTRLSSPPGSPSRRLGRDAPPGRGRSGGPGGVSANSAGDLPPQITEEPPVRPRVTASWSDLPRKDQLVVITLARLSEPLVQTSIQSYMFYQLRWFDPTLPDSVVSSQAGVLQCVLPLTFLPLLKPRPGLT